ncbi:MAG: bifunctional demethylmenaquinone methyltransferase/2-methoxy-6-polyprenyl-1,4-benzoquinol methylase UbiE [Chitinophagales bacterium]|nr:bifunctional demethylmenaquinone methyltransferase/2-methoxy-6-polyprenyl-1,4-benzoquinol methylase UbiE [Chitinophagales bacterium]MDW8393333.1 bifunctional demethylmenaquinone methyltransferase/2-methoxy-6-polyprenyl-1,4-benzoquinol methylase UbiE [Chitinophagales bacterium]
MAPTVLPYSNEQGTKKQQVRLMFDRIAHRYDLLNQLLSLGMHHRWRRQVVEALRPLQPESILDLATGTGDLMKELLQLAPDHITGMDLSPVMLEHCARKLAGPIASGQVQLLEADSESLPFEHNTFDAVTVAFGIRNFEHPDEALRETWRVLRPAGCLAILEFSLPPSRTLRWMFKLHLRYVCPVLGQWLSGDGEAYRYLYRSIAAFPQPEALRNQLLQRGFSQVTWQRLSPGICTLLLAVK